MSTEHLLNVIIAHPSKTFFRGVARMLTVPTTEGEMTLLAHHEPIIVQLKKGTIIVHGELPDAREEFLIERGVLEVSSNNATVLL